LTGVELSTFARGACQRRRTVFSDGLVNSASAGGWLTLVAGSMSRKFE
jgi:hypothetical protein